MVPTIHNAISFCCTGVQKARAKSKKQGVDQYSLVVEIQKLGFV